MVENFIFVIPTGLVVTMAIIVLSVVSVFAGRRGLRSTQILWLTNIFKYAVVLTGLLAIAGIIVADV